MTFHQGTWCFLTSQSRSLAPILIEQLLNCSFYQKALLHKGLLKNFQSFFWCFFFCRCQVAVWIGHLPKCQKDKWCFCACIRDIAQQALPCSAGSAPEQRKEMVSPSHTLTHFLKAASAINLCWWVLVPHGASGLASSLKIQWTICLGWPFFEFSANLLRGATVMFLWGRNRGIYAGGFWTVSHSDVDMAKPGHFFTELSFRC